MAEVEEIIEPISHLEKIIAYYGVGGGSFNIDDIVKEVENKINVKDDIFSTYNAIYYGLKAGEEGKATNTDAMNALITKIGDLGGGTIFIPKGEYYFNKPIVWKSNISLKGEGIDVTILKSFGGTEDSHVQGYPVIEAFKADTVAETPETNNCKFSDFTIDGSELHVDPCVQAKGMYIIRMKNCVWRDIKFKGTGSTALGCDFIANAVIDHVICEDCGRSGYYAGCAGIGIGTKGLKPENFIITNCICTGCYNYGIFIETQELFQGISNLKDFEKRGAIISNCIVHDCVNAGFGIKGGTDISLNNCVSYKNKYGIELGNELNNVQVSNCLIQENTGHGIYVKDLYKLKDGTPYDISGRIIDGLSICGCTIFKNGGDGINLFEKIDGVTIGSGQITNNITIDSCDINKNTRRGIAFNDRSSESEIKAFTEVFVKNNNIVSNGLEGFSTNVKLLYGSFQGNYLSKNNTRNIGGINNILIDCDLGNFDFIFNRVTDSKWPLTCNSGIGIKAGHTFDNTIIKYNILTGHKFEGITTNNVTKTGYTEIQES